MIKIIIADDHPVLMQAVKKSLHEEFPTAFFEVVFDTLSLIEKVENQPWDLVISDFAMSGGGGLNALRILKGKNKNIPVIITSTYPAEQYKAFALNAGADDFVCKDSFPVALILAVRNILEKKFLL